MRNNIERVFSALRVLVLVCVLGAWSSAWAQFFSGTAAEAMGGAGRAAVDPLEAGFLNPAALIHIDHYNVGGSFVTGQHPNTGRIHQVGGVIADGTSAIPGSFAYTRRNFDPVEGENYTNQDFMLAFAAPVYQGVSIGFAGHRLLTKTESLHNYAENNMNVGLLWVPVESIGLGLVAYDVFPVGNGIPEVYKSVPTYGLGFQGSYHDQLRGRFDLVMPDQRNPNRRMIVMTGLETIFEKFLVFRAGAQFNDIAGQTLLTLGLGWKGPRLNASYSFQQDLRLSGAERHLFDLWLPF